jgi:hypothetical protein
MHMPGAGEVQVPVPTIEKSRVAAGMRNMWGRKEGRKVHVFTSWRRLGDLYAVICFTWSGVLFFFFFFSSSSSSSSSSCKLHFSSRSYFSSTFSIPHSSLYNRPSSSFIPFDLLLILLMMVTFSTYFSSSILLFLVLVPWIRPTALFQFRIIYQLIINSKTIFSDTMELLAWRSKSRSSVFWRRTVMWQNTDVSEEHVASIFWSLHPEDIGSMALRNVGILPQHYTASQPRGPRIESCEKLKSHSLHGGLIHRKAFPIIR